VLSFLSAAPINHVLRGESWALRRLQPFAGRTARFETFPFRVDLTVRDTGEIAPASPQATPDATFRVSPAAALRIVAGDSDAFREVVASGDPELAQAVEFVVRNTRWDAEEDLARVFGDSVAHRLSAAGRELVRFQARAIESLSRNLADYWVEERPLIARRSDVEAFVSEVDRLRDDVERLAKRIEAMDR
jgi:ubiquinone biosynthesis protein UbiJ